MSSKKVILTGSFGVGKTSLFNQFIFNRFSDKYLTTIGVKVNKKVVEVDDREVSILLWDIAGEVSQDKVPTSYFLGASGIIYVFDLSRPSTYKNIKSDLEYLDNLLKGGVVRIVGNKRDLISEEDLATIQAEVPVEWDLLTSAKTGENVEQLFQSMGRALLDDSSKPF
ncbi:MAG: Rab family GTPase [Bacteroidota bacterium]